MMQNVDFDLHQILGIRLIDASEREVRAVANQLGLPQTTLARQPDITIRFVERLALSSQIKTLGLGEAGYTDDAFLVLRSKHKSPARVQIDFASIGQGCEMVCERGLPAVPLLIPIINLTALARGALPLHASAFVYNGTGILATGWSKGGKTEMLLAAMAHGAAYVGDEWVYISADGKRMHGIPEPIRLWNWHLQDLPQYQSRVPGAQMNRLKAIGLALSVEEALSSVPGLNRPFGKIAGRVRPLLKKQQHVDVPPRHLFQQGEEALSAPLDKVLFVASHESPEIRVQRMDPDEIATRMTFSLQYEQLNLRSYYLAYRFAFPGRRSELIEHSEELQRERLAQLLHEKPSYGIFHPYPVSLTGLFEAACPYFERK